jgi:uncharacterized protein DUF4007
MTRGPLFTDSYKPQFSGHETFPMRHGWLKKAYDAVSSFDKSTDKRAVFTEDEAISRFGVGKNMVAAIRHWATTVGIISDYSQERGIEITSLGRLLLSNTGLDPYLEHPASLWLIHWQLAGKPDKTTWYWTFNHYSSDTFDRDQLAKGLERLAKERDWLRVASSTIKRDVECFVRTYSAKTTSDHSGYEDTLESPLVELGLIKPISKRSVFRLVRSPKTSLGSGVFLYALVDFWDTYTSTSTLSFEAIAHEPGSPGKVFLLEENDLVNRLQELEDSSHGAYRWSETAGLKQIIRKRELDLDERFNILAQDYALKD